MQLLCVPGAALCGCHRDGLPLATGYCRHVFLCLHLENLAAQCILNYLVVFLSFVWRKYIAMLKMSGLLPGMLVRGSDVRTLTVDWAWEELVPVGAAS